MTVKEEKQISEDIRFNGNRNPFDCIRQTIQNYRWIKNSHPRFI